MNTLKILLIVFLGISVNVLCKKNHEPKNSISAEIIGAKFVHGVEVPIINIVLKVVICNNKPYKIRLSSDLKYQVNKSQLNLYTPKDSLLFYSLEKNKSLEQEECDTIEYYYAQKWDETYYSMYVFLDEKGFPINPLTIKASLVWQDSTCSLPVFQIFDDLLFTQKVRYFQGNKEVSWYDREFYFPLALPPPF